MGLDMYLKAKKYLWGDNTEEVKKVIRDRFNIPKDNRINSVEFTVGYWRKANHIHNWFVEEVQEGEDDCRKHYVSEKDLRYLREMCKQVLDDKSKAKRLLPTKSGFFFGSTEYDEDYFKQLERTIEIIDETLEIIENNKLVDIYYESSW